MRFAILGQTALHIDGNPIPLGATKQRGFIAALLFRVGEPVRVDTIVDLLWNDRQIGPHRTSLYALASRTRAVLNGARVPGALARVGGLPAYRLDLDPELIDYHWFQRRVAAGRRAADEQRYEAAVAALAEAADVWVGEPLADLRSPRAELLRAEMNGAFLGAMKLLAECQLKLGQHHSVLARLEPLVRADNLDETLAHQWISALSAARRNDEARAFFANFRRRFRKEMRAEPAVEPPPPAGTVRVRSEPKLANRAGRRPPRQLPHDINDFVGRDALIARLTEVAGGDGPSTNIVVVNGMPGAGKTTLANHWANLQRERFPDGQAYLNANGFGPTEPTAPHDMLGALLRAFQVAPEQVPDDLQLRQDQLNQILADRRALIVLDNVRDSAQVRPLIPNSGACTVLITSRNRLKGLTIREGARNVTVEPLSEDESTALLSRIIGADRAAAEPDALSALARAASGLPLALRVVGEHIAERPRIRIAELGEELQAELLNSEVDDADVSVRQVFAWSYRTLSEENARLFRRLGLFPGRTFTPGAAAALMERSATHTEQLLNALAKAHLINHDALRRYRFHDLLQRYAADQVLAEEAPDAIHRLLTWYVLTATNAAKAVAPHRPPVPDLPAPEAVEVAEFGTDAEAMRWCQAERANLIPVIRLAITHRFFRHAWQIPGALHEALDRYGRQDDVFELHQLALSAAQADGHLVGQIGTLNNLGFVHLARHDYARAASTLETGLELARLNGHLEAEMTCAHNLASARVGAGEFVEAVALYRRVLAVFQEMGNVAGEAAVLHRLGGAYRAMGQPDAARDYYTSALAIRERVGLERGQGTVHSDLAALYFDGGRFELALRHCELALRLHERAKDEAARCDTLLTAADAKRQLGVAEEAIHDAREASEIAEDIADPQRHARALAVLADCLTNSDSEAARRACSRALEMLEESTDPAAWALRTRLLVTKKSFAANSSDPNYLSPSKRH